ncbi:DoxX family protein [Kibdelosporangium persicum]|uniref:Oxidoreductase n=1 Tax=Kibdelosporangium persicum TaxID=2698649 RepID=A0ABX2F1X2_9PSEU|nr:DoxX family protein [Kibdelosporangium persicum]NRN65227.1 putative oxidoreductase [Kibdelosporangium persicum]
MNLGVLLLRLLLAALLFGHSMQKLRGWFGGLGPRGHGQIFDEWGFVPGTRLAVFAGTLELLGAASIATGLLTPAGAAVVIGTMAVAAAATVHNGFWANRGGCEVPFVYGALAAVIAFSGPGEWSLDHALGLTWNLWWGVVALLAGVLAAVPPIAMRARVLRSRESQRGD